jgi:hypothetical protein
MVQQDGMESPRLALSTTAFGLLLAIEQRLVNPGMKMKQTRLHGRPCTRAYLHPSACPVIYVRRYSMLLAGSGKQQPGGAIERPPPSLSLSLSPNVSQTAKTQWAVS